MVLIGGWLLAKFARFAMTQGAARDQLQRPDRARRPGRLPEPGRRPGDTTGIFGLLVYWLVILAALIIAFNSLGLTYITDLLGEVVLFVPKVIVALLMLAFGAYFARFVGNTVIAYCRNISSRTPTSWASWRSTPS